eukprot:m.320049 g.320049  ORF g.320049 m.320049 type:complete len:172 (-) comp65020_c0_seq1:22-537(-)
MTGGGWTGLVPLRQIASKQWVNRTGDTYVRFSELDGGFAISYDLPSSQIEALTGRVTQGRQSFVFHCKDVFAVWRSDASHLAALFDQPLHLFGSGSTMWTPTSKLNLRLDVPLFRDDCRFDLDTWQKMQAELRTAHLHSGNAALPILDFEIFDIGDENEDFGAEIGICWLR